MIGPVLDSTGVAVTGGVVGDFKISKDGAAPAALNGSATATHRHTGFYSLALTASDLDTVGTAQITIDDTTNSCSMLDIQVVEEAVFDALFASSALGYVANAPVNVAQLSGDSTAADNAEAFFDGTGYAGTNNVIPTVTTLTNLPAITANWLTAAGIAASALNGKGDWLLSTSTGSGFTAIPWNAAWDIEVQSEVQDAIESNNLDHLLKVAAVAGDAVDSSIIARLASKSATPSFASFDNTTDSLEANRDNIGTAGAGLTAVPWNASWDAEVQSEVDDALKATLAEGYRSTGAVGSVRDMLYEIIGHLGESAIVTTTKTVKKIDGSTTAKTYTLDSATTPTSITETT